MILRKTLKAYKFTKDLIDKRNMTLYINHRKHLHTADIMNRRLYYGKYF